MDDIIQAATGGPDFTPKDWPEQAVVHQCPPNGSGIMPCCGATPFERMGDRMTLDPKLVTCALSSTSPEKP